LDRFQKQIKIFKWDGEKEVIKDVNIGDFLSEFMVFKTQFDVQEMTKMIHLLNNNPDISTKELRKQMNYSNNQLRMLLGYKDQICGLGRNYFVMQKYYENFRF
jgi:hypothetical protein